MKASLTALKPVVGRAYTGQSPGLGKPSVRRIVSIANGQVKWEPVGPVATKYRVMSLSSWRQWVREEVKE